MTYKPDEIADLLARLDRREKLDLIEQEVAKRVAQQRPARRLEPEDEPPRLTRSTMKALEKSQYIRQYGKARYDELPWS